MTEEMVWNGAEWINSNGTTVVDPPSDPNPYIQHAYLPWNLTETYPDNTPTYPVNVKKVFPHYFTQFMVKENEANPDYWDAKWVPPGHVEGTTDHAYYGGFVRDRYPYLANFGGTEQNYKTEGMKWEVRHAIAARFDGFTIDILSGDFSGRQWTHIKYLYDAVEAVNAADGTNFKLWLMADGTTTMSGLGSGATLGARIDSSAIAMANLIANMRNRTCQWKPGSVMPIGLFGAERWPSSSSFTAASVGSTATGQKVVSVSTTNAAKVVPGHVISFASGITGTYTVASVNTTTGAVTVTANFAGSAAASGTTITFGPDKSSNHLTNSRVRYWNTLKRELETTYNQPVSFIACYVDTWSTTSQVINYVDGLDMHSRWGVRDWAQNSDPGIEVGGAAAYCRSTYNKPWMHWASPMDTRPAQTGATGTTYKTWESRGSLAFHNSWMASINGDSDLIQVTTWNDFMESAHICPSIDHGFVWCDLSTYYIERYKTGQFPIPKRDGTYLFHRKYRYGSVTPTYSYGQVKKTINAASSSPTVDIIDVLAFLTADATVELLLDGTVINTWNGVTGRNRFEMNLPTSGSVLSARIKRSGSVVSGSTVTSDHPLQWSMAWDDMHYVAYSSLRQANP